MEIEIESDLTISIHALRKESDESTASDIMKFFPFQSTLSVRRATMLAETDDIGIQISIHALRKESDGVHLQKMLV